MKIGSIGYEHIHGPEFVMDRPSGTGAGLFLIIKSTALFRVGGKDYDVEKGSFIIVKRQTPIRYTAKDDKYIDDWFYFDYDDADLERFERLGLPLDEPRALSGVGELSQIFRMLTYEHYSAEEYSLQLENSLLDCLIYKLARLVAVRNNMSAGFGSDKTESLTMIRTKIYSVPEAELNIDLLAQEAGMSRSGFQHSYKKMFGVSPISDIITSRLERAKRLLMGTSLSVEEVSLRCGYKSSYSFMRQFRNKTGKTPTEYRQGTKKN